MYKLLLVQEETIERDALAELVDWKALNVELAACAESAEEAVNLSLTTCFDLLLADSRPVGLHGVELAALMLRHQPRLKAIISDGREADDRTGPVMSSVRFIARPVNMAELRAAVAQAVAELDREREQSCAPERLQELVQQNMALIRRHFFERLVFGSLSDGEILKSLDYFGMGAMQGRFAMLLCELDGFDRQSMSLGWETLHRMLEGVREAVLALKLDGLLDFYYIDRGRFAALLCLSPGEPKNEARRVFTAAECIRNEAALCYGGTVTVGTGCTVSRVRDLRQSYQTATAALASKMINGHGQVLCHTDAALPGIEPGPLDMPALEEGLATAVEMANAADARNLVDRLFHSARRRGWDEGRMRAACLRALSRILLLLHDMGVSSEPVFEGGAAWGKLLSSGSVPQMRDIVDRCVAAAAAQVRERRAEADRAMTGRVLHSAVEHLETRVSAEDLAERFYCSPGYIQAACKRVTGKTLSENLKDLRLERACELLKNPANRIGEVAIQVGYPNVSYFCSLFKRKYGQNPGEYREKA